MIIISLRIQAGDQPFGAVGGAFPITHPMLKRYAEDYITGWVKILPGMKTGKDAQPPEELEPPECKAARAMMFVVMDGEIRGDTTVTH